MCMHDSYHQCREIQKKDAKVPRMLLLPRRISPGGVIIRIYRDLRFSSSLIFTLFIDINLVRNLIMAPGVPVKGK